MGLGIHLDHSKRSIEILEEKVNKIYDAIIKTEYALNTVNSQLISWLPDKIQFIHAEQLRRKFPKLSSKKGRICSPKYIKQFLLLELVVHSETENHMVEELQIMMIDQVFDQSQFNKKLATKT